MDVRVPDDYATERIATISDEEMIEVAIYESIQEANHTKQIENENAMKELEAKRMLFSSIVQKTKRIGVYDNEIKELHNILNILFHEYCEEGITDLSKNEYIMNTITKIRLTRNETQLVHELFN